MNQIVRRKVEPPVPTDGGELLPAKRHSREGIFVESQLALGIEPKLYLSWSVLPRYWAKGYTLHIFHSTEGFSPEKHPHDLARHGQLIVETAHDGSREEHPEEGA